MYAWEGAQKTNLWRPEVNVENNHSDWYAVDNLAFEYADMFIKIYAVDNLEFEYILI